jgi:Alginate lyase
MRYWNLVIAAILVSIINQATILAWSTPIDSDDKTLSDVANIGLGEKIPRTIILDPYVLLEIKQAGMGHDDPIMQEFLKKLIKEANSFLSKKTTSVMDKTQMPPSGDKHDFYSLSHYRWPNPDTPDGLPYVSRDGEINPEIYTIPDKKNLDRMVQTVKILALAYYFTNDPQYASKAEELLRVWFIDEDTYMNPNLKYAESVRGKDEMNPGGIMEGRPLTELTDAIRLLQHSPQWTEKTQQGMELWFTNYLDWLLNSDSGKKEGRKANNHGTYYIVQVSSIALFVNKTGLAKEILEAPMQEPSTASVDDVPKLIAEKIKPDGRQPFELERKNALDYHTVNLLALFRLASIGERVGVDLWNYEFEGAGLRKALDYILPYALEKEPWPYDQIKSIKKSTVAEISCQGMIHYPNNELYIEAYESINTDKLGIDIYYPICNKMTTE